MASNVVFDADISNCMLDYGKELVQWGSEIYFRD